MTNPTRQEIIEAQLARQWAEQVQQFDAERERRGRRYSGDPMRAAAEFILAHTDPPTMAGVEWDDDKHYLAEAEQVSRGDVIMLEVANTGEIRCLTKGLGEIQFFLARPDTFTPYEKPYLWEYRPTPDNRHETETTK